MKMSYETVSEATERSAKNAQLVASGLKKPKDHVGNVDSFVISQDLLVNAASWT